MQATIPEKNNFDLLRFLLALTVCLVHAAQLSGIPDLEFIPKILSSEVAVQSFFAISGFLIVMSYERSSSLPSYLRKRAARIFPAYFTIIFLCALLLATQSNAPQYFFSRGWWGYLAANLSFLNFLHPDLPGVFTSNRISAVNGALWTLKIELAFYLLVPGLCWLIRKFNTLTVLSSLYAASSIYAELASGPMQHQIPGELRFFLAGTACYYYLPTLKRYRTAIAFASLAICMAPATWELKLISPLAIGALTISAGLFFYLGNFGKHGDFSYGIYIIHFPLIQLVVSHGYFSRAPLTTLSLVLVLVISAAIVLWNLVEVRWLRRHAISPVQATPVQP